ncbi:hypothetical protein DFA_06556 [Cavenderia fasciculata]|uniref:Uncharacterized protein n=1 Tax=Cavenderia fasciculata TaxID=261658 RepID=F4PJC0_CACFS|nr:uncharacterized protein DFA_06556 [Cavenderia fasciculata]EGG24406.1 hypothetical protein DFA_06556 [Cavenderia fasciculata]|eukprot:XP_004362257.1 hypothetical protein DFA_06556 [Cavenderia fasciculata]
MSSINPRHTSQFLKKPIFKNGLREILECINVLEQKVSQQRLENKGLDVVTMDTLAYCYLEAREIGYLQKSVAMYGEILFIIYASPMSGMQIDYAITIGNLAFAKFNLDTPMYVDALGVCNQIAYNGPAVASIIVQELTSILYPRGSLPRPIEPDLKQFISNRLNQAFSVLSPLHNQESIEYVEVLFIMAKYNGYLLYKQDQEKELREQTIKAFDSVLACYLKVYGPIHPKYAMAMAYKSYAYTHRDEECTQLAMDAVPLVMQYYGELYIEVLLSPILSFGSNKYAMSCWYQNE